MGFFDKIKGWLNIGGPKISILEIEQPISGKFGVVSGRARVVSKREAKLKQFTARFVMEETKGKGEEKTTETTVIAEQTMALDVTLNPEEPFDLDIHISYDVSTLSERLAEKGGLLGAVGKVGKIAGKLGEKGIMDYHIEAAVDVVGTALDPSDKMAVRAILED